MYTGIVERTGTITAAEGVGAGRRIRVETDAIVLEPEESIAVDGVCVTAERVGEGWFEAWCSSETVDRTTLADRSPGDAVNLERPLPADGRFHGHFVGGTVDTTTELLAIDGAESSADVDEASDDAATIEAAERTLTFALPEGYEGYVVEKGPVALDGISLTVASVSREAFSVAVVPTTAAVTTLSAATAGDAFNLEVDTLAKYAERQRELADERAP